MNTEGGDDRAWSGRLHTALLAQVVDWRCIGDVPFGARGPGVHTAAGLNLSGRRASYTARPTDARPLTTPLRPQPSARRCRVPGRLRCAARSSRLDSTGPIRSGRAPTM